MIDTSRLNILQTYKYIRLSSQIDNWEAIVPGTYCIYHKNNYNETVVEQVELKEDKSIGLTNLECWNPRIWNVIIHPGRYMASQNSFDIAGMSTMEIIYINEKIIYCIGYPDVIYIFVKKEYDSEYDEDKILLHFAKIQNYWLKENEKLKLVTLGIDRIINDSVTIWGPSVVGFIFAYILYYFVGGIHYFYYVIPVILVFILILRTVLKLMRKCKIKKYKKEHPNDKLANSVTFDAFNF